MSIVVASNELGSNQVAKETEIGPLGNYTHNTQGSILNQDLNVNDQRDSFDSK